MNGNSPFLSIKLTGIKLLDGWMLNIFCSTSKLLKRGWAYTSCTVTNDLIIFSSFIYSPIYLQSITTIKEFCFCFPSNNLHGCISITKNATGFRLQSFQCPIKIQSKLMVTQSYSCSKKITFSQCHWNCFSNLHEKKPQLRSVLLSMSFFDKQILWHWFLFNMKLNTL